MFCEDFIEFFLFAGDLRLAFQRNLRHGRCVVHSVDERGFQQVFPRFLEADEVEVGRDAARRQWAVGFPEAFGRDVCDERVDANSFALLAQSTVPRYC